MTAINENGQVFWTFEELDFEGALQPVLSQVRVLLDFNESLHVDSKVSRAVQNKIDRYLKVALYLERLKRGQNYA